ncbi:MAG TPA: hypothetical protein V6D06_02355 [Trichocoleus sp.]
MAFFRAYIAPLFIVLIFVVAMVAVSARTFLPSDMMAPAPVETLEAPAAPDLSAQDDILPPDISMLLHGQPDKSA